MIQKHDILAFLRKHSLAVLATADVKGRPQAAVVEFAELDDLTIIIDTFNYSRKYKNLQQNDQVAIVIGWDNNVTLQIDATAHELNGEDLARAKDIYFAKNERAKKWGDKPEIAYFAFRPIWMRYSDVGKTPWLIEEVRL
ncbi:MAG TPA: pyridoxamine 5'-phosphate oxidase family protein [Candidatus Saccharibacteria bacterium]|nr:pyridoxamine 5'-phosphate oxidase family protein [Candidatus Saccharibacteria bacterium]